MSDKTVVYLLKMGDKPVPLTIRIEWLPCGTVQPVKYWTPDGSRYDVKQVYECVQLSHLKEQGIGVRFKVRAEITEAYEPDSNVISTHDETYLYFADNWFCGRNMIDGRYGHTGKEFVAVILDVFPDCDYELIYFTAKGKRYEVERTLSIEPCGSFNAGGIGIKHRVKARLMDTDEKDFDVTKNAAREAALFFEINKWFVAVKNTT